MEKNKNNIFKQFKDLQRLIKLEAAKFDSRK
jgi:hypothetical protein